MSRVSRKSAPAVSIVRASRARDARLDLVFSALGDRTRRSILVRLSEGPKSVTEIAEPLPMSLPAVSKHLRVLEEAGLLRRERDGRFHQMSLEGRPLEEASAFLARYRVFWEDTLAKLAAHVEDDDADDDDR
jgi:DNA-binding transcriptional ArsR family regulator